MAVWEDAVVVSSRHLVVLANDAVMDVADELAVAVVDAATAVDVRAVVAVVDEAAVDVSTRCFSAEALLCGDVVGGASADDDDDGRVVADVVGGTTLDEDRPDVVGGGVLAVPSRNPFPRSLAAQEQSTSTKKSMYLRIGLRKKKKK